jgi:hypothetical protein
MSDTPTRFGEIAMTDIEICPFCGSADIDPDFSFGYSGGDIEKPEIAAGCYSCKATGPCTSAVDREAALLESIKAWNARVTVTPKTGADCRLCANYKNCTFWPALKPRIICTNGSEFNPSKPVQLYTIEVEK